MPMGLTGFADIGCFLAGAGRVAIVVGGHWKHRA